jgi:hypothetical protein
MAAVRRAAGEGGPTREFKYSQEISQMVRLVKVAFYRILKCRLLLQDVRFWRGPRSKHGHRQFGGIYRPQPAY